MENAQQKAASKQPAPALTIWQHRNFALFMTGIGPYYITSWMQRVGIGWLAWELTHSPAWLGLIAAADLAPMLLLAPIGGAYVDRSNPVTIIRLCMVGFCIQAVLLTTLTLTGLITIEFLFALALTNGLIAPFYAACRQTIVATSVPKSIFPSAIATDASFYHGSRFLGPAIAAYSIVWIGIGGTFIAHIFGTIIFFIFQSMMDVERTERGSKQRGNLLDDVKEGISYVRHHDGIWPIFMLMTVTSIAARPLQDMLPGFAGAVFNAGPEGLAILASGMGAGALATSVLLAMRGTVSGLTRICIAACLVLAAAIYAFVSATNIWIGVIFATLAAMALNTMATATHTLVQNTVADEMRGRVVGLYSLIYRGTPAFGAVIIGFLAESIGLPASFTISTIVCLAAFVTVLSRARKMTEALEGRHT